MTTTPTPDMLMLFGHSHPLLVHLPIGFLVLLVVLEIMAKVRRFQHLAPASGVILVLALLSASFSAACGWLLARGGAYDATLITVHRWCGVGVAAACLLTLIFYKLGRDRLYNLGLFATFVLVVVAGHYGGSLTHGRDFLTQNLPTPVRRLLGEPEPRPPIADPEQAIAFADIVQPALAEKCGACHGAGKQQAKLRLDEVAAMLQGGENGPAIVPGDAAHSLLLTRVQLPAEDSKHMPPAGKPQLSDTELTLIRWWIDAGASPDKKVADLKPTARVYAALDSLSGSPETAAPPKPLAELGPLADKLADQVGILIQPIAKGEPWLEINASLRGMEFGDAELAQLTPLAANVRWLDLGGTRVSDTGLAQVAGMPHVTRLDLHRTGVTDAGLARLVKLRELEYLNLYGTAVSDAGLPPLRRLANLHRLYLWQTQVRPDSAKALAGELEDKDHIARLERNIESLQQEISRAQIEVNMGDQTNAPPSAAGATNAPAGAAAVAVAAAAAAPTPVNTLCPVSGKPIDPAQTVTYEGKVIAFCCPKCPAEFNKDPAPFLKKLNLAAK